MYIMFTNVRYSLWKPPLYAFYRGYLELEGRFADSYSFISTIPRTTVF